jgi:delta24-sterol reductase
LTRLCSGSRVQRYNRWWIYPRISCRYAIIQYRSRSLLNVFLVESTSHKYGYLHDVCVGFEVVLADGRVLWCDRNNNADLFYGLPGTFGSLGICTRAKILCMKASSHIQLACISHDNHEICISHMTAMQDSKRADFIEGIGYSENQCVSIIGSFVSREEIGGHAKVHRCNGFMGNKWFFNQVRDVIKRKQSPMYIHTKDYLFRHDQGSFWMASYRIPQFIALLMGPLLDSTNMFKLANMFPMAFPKKSIVLQDFTLPRETVCSFIDEVQKLLRIYPLWLLPMKNVKSKGILFGPPPTKSDLCNVGVYGIPRNKYEFESCNKILESVLFRSNGRKVYYSHAYYTRGFFYGALHDGLRYFNLRSKFCKVNMLPEIYDKVITKDSRL